MSLSGKVGNAWGGLEEMQFQIQLHDDFVIIFNRFLSRSKSPPTASEASPSSMPRPILGNSVRRPRPKVELQPFEIHPSPSSMGGSFELGKTNREPLGSIVIWLKKINTCVMTAL